MDAGPIPAFLLRAPSPEARARADEIVRQTTEGKRGWAPMRSLEEIRASERTIEAVKQSERRAEEMAKYNQLIKNRAAPVELLRYPTEGGPGADPVFVRNFADMDEFERFYRGPPVHRDLGVTCTAETTTILLDIAGNPNLVPKSAPLSSGEKVVKVPRAVGPKAKGKWYIVNSHVGMILRAEGFQQKSNEDSEPLTFVRGDDVCVIPEPAADKKSSSKWEATVKGKLTAGFGVAIFEDVLRGKK